MAAQDTEIGFDPAGTHDRYIVVPEDDEDRAMLSMGWIVWMLFGAFVGFVLGVAVVTGFERNTTTVAKTQDRLVQERAPLTYEVK